MSEAVADMPERRLAWWRRFLRWLKEWFRVDFSDLRPREKWVYAVWGVFGFLVAFPELWAAIAAHTTP